MNLSNQFWIVAGKVGAALGVIAAVITIITVLPSEKPKLVAQVGWSPFYVPNPAIEALQRSRTCLDADSLKTSSVLAKKLTTKDIEKLAAGLTAAWDAAWRDADEDLLFPNYKEIYVLIIRNRGGEAARDVVVILPRRGRVGFTTDNQTKDEKVKDNAHIGTIRPGQEVTVVYWSETVLSGREMRSILVTHEKGRATMQFVHHAYGAQAVAARLVEVVEDNPLSVAFLALWPLWLVIDALRDRARARRTAKVLRTLEAPRQPGE